MTPPLQETEPTTTPTDQVEPTPPPWDEETTIAKLPHAAAALLLSVWMFSNRNREFSAPKQVMDSDGTFWQVVKRPDSYQLVGKANHFALRTWDEKMGRLRQDLASAIGLVRPLKLRLQQIEADLQRRAPETREFGNAKAVEAALDNDKARENDRIGALQNQKAEMERQYAPANERKEQLETEIAELETQKPRDLRYMLTFSADLKELKVRV